MWRTICIRGVLSVIGGGGGALALYGAAARPDSRLLATVPAPSEILRSSDGSAGVLCGAGMGPKLGEIGPGFRGNEMAHCSLAYDHS